MKKLLSLALVLALCLGLTVSALAAEDDPLLDLDVGETTFVINGVTFTLSNPVSGHTTDDEATYPVPGRTINVVPAGTTVTLSPSENIDDKVWGEAYGIDEETGEPTWLPVDMTTVNGGSFDGESIISFASSGEDDTYIYITGRTPGEAAPAGTEAPAETETPAEKPAEAPAGAPASKFTDVDPASPFAEAIQWAVSQGITNGKTDTTFGPGDTCTRGQILTFLYRANGSPKPKAEAALGAYYEDWADIPASFADAARWVNDEHLMRNAGSVFGAATSCTRGEAMTHLWAAAGRPSVSSSFIKKFTDMQSQSNELSEAVAWAVQHKITTGTTETTFSPDTLCTRGQIVTFLYRAYAK